ncbi:hypothetical protein [Lysobacter sp. CA196]
MSRDRAVLRCGASSPNPAADRLDPAAMVIKLIGVTEATRGCNICNMGCG